MWRERYSQNKYHAKSTIYNGIQYHSKKEAAYASELDIRRIGKDIKSWIRQVPIELCVGGRKICTYYVDFSIQHNDNHTELVEIKGFETEIWRLKRKLLEATYLIENPSVTYTVIK